MRLPRRLLFQAELLVLFLAVALPVGCGAPAASPAPDPASLALGGGPAVSGAAQLENARAPVAETPSPVPTAPPAPTPPPTPMPTPPVWGPAPARVRDVAPPNIQARAAVVVDGASGAVLYDKDAHTPLPPASTTKILTALIALEKGNLDEEIEVQLDPARTYWGSVMGLQNGDRFTLGDLLYGLMLPSGNDAAYVIATHIAGSERAFAELMHQRMREIGLIENQWLNASGLGRETANTVSAYDLAQLSRVAMANPAFATIVGTKAYTARGSRVLGMRNGNELLYSYPGADGVKIGWGGRSAGNTLVGSAVRNGYRLFVVLLNTPDRPGEAAALLNWAFATHQWP